MISVAGSTVLQVLNKLFEFMFRLFGIVWEWRLPLEGLLDKITNHCYNPTINWAEKASTTNAAEYLDERNAKRRSSHRTGEEDNKLCLGTLGATNEIPIKNSYQP